MCPKCNFHNYSSKTVCIQCSTPKPPPVVETVAVVQNADDVSTSSKRRKSRWDETADGKVPEWLQDIFPGEKPKPQPPPGINPENFKVMDLDGCQIRALIGKGGETIQGIRLKSGAEVKIDHLPSDPVGRVTIVGDVPKVEELIKDTLATKGCPLGSSAQPGMMGRQLTVPVPPGAPGGPSPGTMPVPGVPPVPGVTPAIPPRPGTAGARPGMPAGPLETREVPVPTELVGGMIGPGGSSINELRQKVGNGVFISILPPPASGGPQMCRLSGTKETVQKAEELVNAKIVELQAARKPPAPLAGVPAPGMGSPGRPGYPVLGPRGLVQNPLPPPAGSLRSAGAGFPRTPVPPAAIRSTPGNSVLAGGGTSESTSTNNVLPGGASAVSNIGVRGSTFVPPPLARPLLNPPPRVPPVPVLPRALTSNLPGSACTPSRGFGFIPSQINNALGLTDPSQLSGDPLHVPADNSQQDGGGVVRLGLLGATAKAGSPFPPSSTGDEYNSGAPGSNGLIPPYHHEEWRPPADGWNAALGP